MKYRILEEKDFVEGLNCEERICGEYESHITFSNQEAAERHWLESKSWKPYILTKEDVEGLKKYTGDIRNSPGIGNFLFRVYIED